MNPYLSLSVATFVINVEYRLEEKDILRVIKIRILDLGNVTKKKTAWIRAHCTCYYCGEIQNKIIDNAKDFSLIKEIAY